MKVLVIGCGAIGSVYAVKVARVAEVFVFDVWRNHVDAINRSGLRLTTDTGEQTAWVKATDRPSDVPQDIDFAIVAVKSIHTRESVQSLRNALTGSVALSI